MSASALAVAQSLSIGQYLKWGRKHVATIILIGDAASQLPSAPSNRARGEIIAPLCPEVGGAIDDLIDPSAVSVFSAEDETKEDEATLEADLLAEVNLQLAMQSASTGVAFSPQAARDGRWLKIGLELFKLLLPILLKG